MAAPTRECFIAALVLLSYGWLGLFWFCGQSKTMLWAFRPFMTSKDTWLVPFRFSGGKDFGGRWIDEKPFAFGSTNHCD